MHFQGDAGGSAREEEQVEIRWFLIRWRGCWYHQDHFSRGSNGCPRMPCPEIYVSCIRLLKKLKFSSPSLQYLCGSAGWDHVGTLITVFQKNTQCVRVFRATPVSTKPHIIASQHTSCRRGGKFHRKILELPPILREGWGEGEKCPSQCTCLHSDAQVLTHLDH